MKIIIECPDLMGTLLSEIRVFTEAHVTFETTTIDESPVFSFNGSLLRDSDITVNIEVEEARVEYITRQSRAGETIDGEVVDEFPTPREIAAESFIASARTHFKNITPF